MASSSLTSSVAKRYARSLHELAEESKAVAKVEAGLTSLEKALEGSTELRQLFESPVYSSEEQAAAIDALVSKAKTEPLVANFLRVVARNRRLFAVPSIITAFREIAADARGEATAQVTSAQPLSAAQMKELQATLKGIAGKDVAVDATVDPSILGGLVVKMGSRQIDTSLKTKLSSLKLALKEVG